MNLLEYEAKRLLAKHRILVPQGEIIESGEVAGVSTPVVLKSQVPTGGRGKLGGIKLIDTPDELSPAISELFRHPIKGNLPSVLLAEEKLNIQRELYLSLTIDRSAASIQVVAHPKGGVEVEDNDIVGFFRTIITPETIDTAGEQLAECYDLPEQTFALQDLVERLYNCFVKNDATLIEINPLIVTADSKLVAGDCKMTLDTSATFRHPEWNFEHQSTEANFVTLDAEGTVATVANGAGLAMATVDAVADYGMMPANFLDIGGGANTESVMKAFARIMDYPNIKVIVINIFAGITRCDEVAKAIIQAKKEFESLPPLCIRLAGTNYQQAAELLSAEYIPLLPTLEACLQSAKEYGV